MSGPGVDLTNHGARFAGAPGAVRLVARTGDHAPGTPDGVRFGVLDGIHLFSDSGHVALMSPLVGPGVVTDADSNHREAYGWGRRLAPAHAAGTRGRPRTGHARGRLLRPAPVLHQAHGRARPGRIPRARPRCRRRLAEQRRPLGRLARRRHARRPRRRPAPGLPAGVRYGVVGEPYLNGSGDVGFAAEFTGSGINVSNYAGVFAGPPGAVQLVARTGQQAPGLPAGTQYENTLGPVKLNDAGHVAFGGSANGQPAAWAGPPDALQLIAIGGTQAPGAPDGIGFYRPQAGPYLSPDGDVAMVWELEFRRSRPTITASSPATPAPSTSWPARAMRHPAPTTARRS